MLAVAGGGTAAAITTNQNNTSGTSPGEGVGRAYTRIALYRGNVVALKPVHKKSVDITRAIRKELKQVRYFIGFSMEMFNETLEVQNFILEYITLKHSNIIYS